MKVDALLAEIIILSDKGSCHFRQFKNPQQAGDRYTSTESPGRGDAIIALKGADEIGVVAEPALQGYIG